MGSPKPCFGHPSRTAAVHAFRAEGLDTHAIAAKIGISPKNVVALECSSGRTRTIRTRRPSEQMGRTVVFPVDVLAALGPHAAKRNISVNQLARLIVSTVVDEDMIDAVMNDAVDLDWSA